MTPSLSRMKPGTPMPMPARLSLAARGAHLVDDGDHVRQHHLASLLGVGAVRDFVQHFAAAVDRRRAQVGATQIQSDGVFSHEGES